MFINYTSGTSQAKQPDSSDLTNLLFKAAKNNDVKKMNSFLAHGADIHSLNKHGQTVLHVAARKRNLDTVKFILVNGLLDPNIKSKGGEPPIFLTKSVTMLRLLVSYGASIKETNSYGIPLLHYAASKNHYRIVSELVNKHNVDVNTRDPEGKTPLHFAAALERYKTTKELLQLGANVDAQTSRMHTPLHYVVIGKHKTNKVAMLLIGPYGNARYNIKDSTGKTALDLAAANRIENEQNGVRESILLTPTLNAAKIHRSRKKLRASISFPLKNYGNRKRSPLAKGAIQLNRKNVDS